MALSMALTTQLFFGMAARQVTGLKWETGAAPTFHEQRSLSERLYRKQGVDPYAAGSEKTGDDR